jgi:uncharacterized membrane protein
MNAFEIRRFLSVGFLACAGVSACSDDGSAEPHEEVVEDVAEFDGDCTKIPPPPGYAVVASEFFVHCVGCHSSTLPEGARPGAPIAVNFDTYESAKAAALLGAATVKQRLMPYPDGSGLTNVQRNLFYAWAICGTPP